MIRSLRWIVCLLSRRWEIFSRQAYTDLLEQEQITANGDWRLTLIPGCSWFEGYYVVWRMRRGTARVIRQGCTFGEAVQLVNRYAVSVERRKRQRDFQLDYGGVVSWARRTKRRKAINRL